MAVLLSLLLTGSLVLAVVLAMEPRRGAVRRLRTLLGRTPKDAPPPGVDGRNPCADRSGTGLFASIATLIPGVRAADGQGSQDAMTLAVQHMAALLKGGRNPSRLWEELVVVHGSAAKPEPAGPRPRSHGRQRATAGHTMSGASLGVLAAARGAARLGAPVPAAIRNAALTASFQEDSRERRVWFDVAACMDVADASGCPLADVLARLAAQLEVEDDADAARQTALAGPRSTVTLLSWLPLTGLGLGIALGVDPLAMLLGTPLGIAALMAGAVLTVLGRVWSARLVRSAVVGL
ncbi:hypothetical protein V1639_03450 [Pseudarthrobacter sp. J75]|uniref:type II secretion system F family protein n=1 Tax=unclassified Pseudarthrobacter TaxID=2647000 RepID=UPI002E81D613|nr:MULTISPECIES: hypothetical protein [unclassified Pseudarthrobacter]MEE2522269.1 hypothetical protein [Pseudarthrobacter sp. J47]MEE2528085.1 hypothetical protein [Pseudarthrobacter sp. J75]